MSDSAKGCHACRHLEWRDGEDESGSGWDCIKRHDAMYQQGKEHVLLNNLDRDAYRNQYKRCFDAKEPA